MKKLIYGAVPARSSGFDDRRNPRRDSEPSAKPPRDSDKARNLETLFFAPAQCSFLRIGTPPPRLGPGQVADWELWELGIPIRPAEGK